LRGTLAPIEPARFGLTPRLCLSLTIHNDPQNPL
jgi:hypothetical protein